MTAVESTTSSSVTTDLLIVGAGPVGLTAAVEAQRLGLKVRIIDRAATRSNDSRALVVHPRVLELINPMGNGSVVDKIKDAAMETKGIRIHFSYDDTILADFGTARWGDTDFPSSAFLPQFETMRFLEEELIAGGGSVDYNVSLEGLSQTDEAVTATLRHADGKAETCISKYHMGCDGGRSRTRELIGVEMHRARSKVYFIVGDVKLTSSPLEDENVVHIFPRHGACALFPLPKYGNYRIVFQAPEGITNESEITMDSAFFEQKLLKATGLTFGVDVGEWVRIFEITHGMSSSHKEGRIFLAGDASHVHSPIGGQGMNFGMQDAINIVWKLSWAERCVKHDPTGKGSAQKILNSYEEERHAIGSQLVGQIETATAILTSRNPFIRMLRNFALRYGLVGRFPDNARRMGQLELRYKPSWSSIILDGHSWWDKFICAPGDRLPNIRLSNGSTLHAQMDRVHHTWVFLNMDAPDSVAKGSKVVSVTPGKEQVTIPAIPEQTLTKPQVVLVRPDLFVAGVDKFHGSLLTRMQEVVGKAGVASM